MKINNISNITNKYISKVSSKNSKNKLENNSVDSKKSKKYTDDVSTDNNKSHYQTIYNNATLNQYTGNDKQLTDEEINKEVDMKIYKEYRLEEEGIEFGSDEFRAWQEKYKDNIPIPLNAPAMVRKELCDMISSVKNPKAKYRICKELWRGFKNVDASNIKSCVSVTNNILKNSKDYLTLLKICNGNSNKFKDVIDYYSEIVDLLTKFKSNIKSLITEKNK